MWCAMSKRALLIILLVAACGPGVRLRGKTTAAAAPPKLKPVHNDALREFDAGLRALKLGGPEADERATERFEAAGKLDPQLWEAWHNLGILYAREGDDGASADAFGKAISVNGASTASYRGRAEANRRLHRYEAARRDYEAVLSVDSKDAATLLRLASLLREMGNLDGALDTVREALRDGAADKSVSSKAYVELGLLYLAGGKQELAEFVLLKAADLDKTSPVAWNALALLSLARGNDQEAFERFDRATSLDPSFRDARFNKASVLLDAGDYARAADELSEIVKNDDGDIDAQIALGVAFRGEQQYDRAKATWEKVLKLAPKQPDALFNLAVLSQDFTKEEKGARDYLARYLQLAPADHPKRKDAEIRVKELGAAK
jgi:Tfp pilus assembly protein PilF